MLKYVIRGMYFIFLAVSSIQFGCDDGGVTPDPQSQNIITVSGNVISFWGEPKANIKVSTDSVTVYTDAQGNFTIPDVVTPYTLYISDSASSQFYVLKNLTTPVVKFLFTSSPYGISTNTCGLKVIVPQNGLTNSSQARFIFTDGKGVNAYGLVNSINYYEQIRLGSTSVVNGKVIVLGYTEVNSKVNSYGNFGYKNLTLSAGSLTTITFDSSEIAFNPDESVISGSFLNCTPGNLSGGFTIYFGENHSPNYTSQMAFGSLNSDKDFNYVVPANLPIFYKPFIFTQELGSQSSFKKCRIAINPGATGVNYELPSSSTLLTPSEGAGIADLNTEFTFTGVNRPGIYVLRIYVGSKSYAIYTNEFSSTLECLRQLGFTLSQGKTYMWSVQYIGDYSTLDGYVNDPRNLTQYSSESDQRMFTAQ